MPVGFHTLGLGELRPFWSALKTWKMETLKPKNVAVGLQSWVNCKIISRWGYFANC